MEATHGLNGNGSKKMNLKILENHLILSIVTSVFSALGVGIFFYFNTNYTLANHTEKLNSLEMRVTKVEQNLSDVKTDIATIKTDVNYLKSDVIEIKQSQKQMQEDMKDIYKIVLTLKNK